MLTELEKKKLKEILFNEKPFITYESSDCHEFYYYKYTYLKSKHFELYITENVYKFSFDISVFYIDKENKIYIPDLFLEQEITDIINIVKEQQEELKRSAEEEEKKKKEKEENILRKFIKKFK